MDEMDRSVTRVEADENCLGVLFCGYTRTMPGNTGRIPTQSRRPAAKNGKVLEVMLCPAVDRGNPRSWSRLSPEVGEKCYWGDAGGATAGKTRSGKPASARVVILQQEGIRRLLWSMVVWSHPGIVFQVKSQNLIRPFPEKKERK